MDDLTTWLKARLDAIELSDWHERTCQTHQKMPHNSPLGLGGSPLSCLCGVPDFVLRDVESKRKLIEEHRRYGRVEPCCAICGERSNDGDLYGEWPCDTLKLLALPFSDRPGYRSEWKP